MKVLPFSAFAIALVVACALLTPLLSTSPSDDERFRVRRSISASSRFSHMEGMSTTRYDSAGRPIGRISAETLSLAAAKLGPFRLGPFREVKGQNVSIDLYDRSRTRAFSTTVSGAVGGRSLVRFESRDFRLRLLRADGDVRCEIRSRRARWSGFRKTARDRLELAGDVVVTAPSVGRIYASSAYFDFSDRDVEIRGRFEIDTTQGFFEGVGLETPCDLSNLTR